MSLAFGSFGPQVRELQTSMNLLPKSGPPLVVDGQFGPRTRARVVEFQRLNGLAADGIVGPITLAAIAELLGKLGPTPPSPPAAGPVRDITQQILGMPATNGLVQQIIPAVALVDVATFKPGVADNAPQFTFAPLRTARLGIFAAGKNGVERAVILLLPAAGVPDRAIIGISHGFGQNAKFFDGLGWQDPLSPPLIQFVLLKHVINRWGAQVLAAKRPMALVHVVRAQGKELGPFASDGAFTRDVLTHLRALTGDAFSFDKVEAFTFSSGINDFNQFVSSITPVLDVAALYSIDPAPPTPVPLPAGGMRKQFLSGSTGAAHMAGFESMLMPRWKHEPLFAGGQLDPFKYLHNHCMPAYALHLGIQTS